MSARRNDPFNNPFHQARKELKDQHESWHQQQRDDERAREAEPPDPPDPPQSPPDVVDEDRSFSQAMAGVKPLNADERVVPSRPARLPRAVLDADAEACAVLADLVDGQGDFDISNTVEYVEGVANGVDRRLVKQLRQGVFSRQGHLDLHGFTRDEARTAVEQFLAESRVGRKRCVLVIHGRGLNSPGRVPVLKNALVRWLTRGGLAKHVLAFTTALPTDGGAGALYVLLRK
jgi:DNA-nicking Smr family endonuclease